MFNRLQGRIQSQRFDNQLKYYGVVQLDINLILMQIIQDPLIVVEQEQIEKYKLSEEEKKCLDTISSFEQFYNFKNHQSLVRIFLSKPLSVAFFDSNKVEISSLFGGDQKEEIEEGRIKLFSKKYSFERLCEKFIYPKGTINIFKKIIRYKLRSEYIESHNTRKNVWLLASGGKYSMKLYRGMYKTLNQMENYPESYTRAIDLDLNRTGAKESPQSMAAMRRMLVAFSRKNPFIGYCQGLNFIAYFILTMQFAEEEGFWLFSQLLETIIPMDYYTNMIGVVTDQRIFLQILRQHSPKIATKFKEVGLDPSVFTIEWFVCLFTSSVPFYLVQIIWDRLIIEGTSALLKTGIIILQEFQDQIMKATDFPDIIILVEQRSKKLSLSELQFNLKYENIYINKRILQLARDMYRQLYIKQKLAEKVVRGVNKNLYKDVKCDRSWPVCLQVLEKNKKEREDCYSWTFKKASPPEINLNYLDRLDGEGVNLIDNNHESILIHSNSPSPINSPQTPKGYSFKPDLVAEDLVIGRMEHICPVITIPPLEPEEIKLEERLAGKQIEKKLSKSDFQIAPSEEDMEEENLSTFSFFENKQINDKAAERLKRAKSMFFYQKFIFNNKQLGEIIANESLKENQ